MAKVSIIIPVYGVEQYIAKCAESLFEQTFVDIEFLFIDDCSPDNSIGVVKSVLEQYPNRASQVRIHKMPENSGQGAVRRWGFENAVGDYVYCCDSDDWIERETIASMYDTAINNNADLVLCEIAWNNGYNMPFFHCANKIELLEATLSGRVIESLCTKLIKRTLLDTSNFISPRYNANEDCVYSLQIIQACNRFVQIPNHFYHYIMRQGSSSHGEGEKRKLEHVEQYKENIQIMDLLLEKYGLREQLHEALDAKKYRCKNLLIPLINHAEIRKIWKVTYSEINFRILFNKYITLREKCVYVCAYWGIYHRIRRYFTRNKQSV